MEKKKYPNWNEKFMGDLSKENELPAEAKKIINDIIDERRLFRYTKSCNKVSEVTMFEREIADFTGARYALAVNSCGSAIYVALSAIGIKPGDEVMMSSFTFTAVPSAIKNIGAKIVLVDCGMDCCMDVEDFKRKITPNTKALVLSYMRGHVGNLSEISKICDEKNIYLVEDCAHALGCYVDGKHVGRFGAIGCFSAQSYKIVNAGEGGFLITDSLELISRCILFSGSHGDHWKMHDLESTEYVEKMQEYIPNYSLRMSSISAGILRSQIPYLRENIKEYNRKGKMLEDILHKCKYIRIPEIAPGVERVRDSIQFGFEGLEAKQIAEVVELLVEAGISAKKFDSPKNPRDYRNWKFFENIDKESLPLTDRLLATTCDIRLPLWLSDEDISNMGRIITKAVEYAVEND